MDCDLTQPQKAAVREAISKLRQAANNGITDPDGTVLENPWGDNDERWEALNDLLLVALSQSLQDAGLADSGAGIVSTDLPSDVTAITGARGGAMRERELNTIKLNKNKWSGPNADRFDSPHQRSSCWILASALLHEGTHQNDCYPWPPTPGSADDRLRWCAEETGYTVELASLCSSLSDYSLPPDASPEEAASLNAAGDDHQRRKESVFGFRSNATSRKTAIR